MVDQITLNRVELLHPLIREEARDIYINEIAPALSGDAYCRFAYTLRTFEEQDALYAQGRTKLFDNMGNRLGIITNARAGQSMHNFALALDIVLITKGKASWDTTIDFDGDGINDWAEVVSIFKRHKWEWGGEWRGSLRDRPHFQKTFGHGWRSLLTLYENDDFIPGTQYVNI